ncbi:MAG: phosphoribosylamine--glycine ligase, partial [Chloroflexota bacterium]|nr:phosphoribosylamine--glycine ligase [Chloroflexota bacterium]
NRSARVDTILCAPGNAGIAAEAAVHPIKVTEHDRLVKLARQEQVGLVVIGPEDPLAAGLADRFTAAGIPVASPSAAATRIESSKAWAKALMDEADVPTANAVSVRDRENGIRAIIDLSDEQGGVVIKADGLAAGKGVVVADNQPDAIEALNALITEKALGEAGSTVVIEERLRGQEVSVLALTDGTTVRPLIPARDYKRAYDNDVGPNTGGMGAYSPVPVVSPDMLDQIQRRILEPVVAALAKHNAPMRGVLFAGLMLTDEGPKVLEFNARFGDPETQVVLPILNADMGELLDAVAHGHLDEVKPVGSTGAAVGVVLASGGYPRKYEIGKVIHGLDDAVRMEHVLVFHAGTARNDAGETVTAGGRVLTVVGLGPDLGVARDRAYAAADRIRFDGMQRREDVALHEMVKA